MYAYAFAGVLALLVLLLMRVRAIEKATALGFFYDDGLSHSQNKYYAMRLRRYAHEAADMFEVSGYLPENYQGSLVDLGLNVSVVKTRNPFEIADICSNICSALKC